MPVAWSQSANALITNAAGTALCENCCPVQEGCENTQVHIVVNGVGPQFGGPGDCGNGCSDFNDDFILPFIGLGLLPLSGCPALADSIYINRDYLCGYIVTFTVCGETYTWDALIAGQIGVGWAFVLGVRSPGVYNFNQGGVSDFCLVWDVVKLGSGQLLDFTYTINVPPFDDECGNCNSFFCEWDSYSISIQIENT